MISPAQVHLLLNHILIVGLGTALLLLLLAEVRRNSGLARAGWIVLIPAAAFAVPTYLTGEAAEEAIKHLPGVAGELIETHEERALIALVITVFGGILGLVSLWTAYTRSRTPRLLALATLLAVLGGAGSMAWTGYAGGKIRHPESRAAILPAAGGAELGKERAGKIVP